MPCVTYEHYLENVSVGPITFTTARAKRLKELNGELNDTAGTATYQGTTLSEIPGQGSGTLLRHSLQIGRPRSDTALASTLEGPPSLYSVAWYSCQFSPSIPQWLFRLRLLSGSGKISTHLPHSSHPSSPVRQRRRTPRLRGRQVRTSFGEEANLPDLVLSVVAMPFTNVSVNVHWYPKRRKACKYLIKA